MKKIPFKDMKTIKELLDRSVFIKEEHGVKYFEVSAGSQIKHVIKLMQEHIKNCLKQKQFKINTVLNVSFSTMSNFGGKDNREFLFYYE